MSEFELIEVKKYTDLPKGIEFLLYEPPFYGDDIQEAATAFRKKFGDYPQTIYRLGNKLFVVKKDKNK